MGTVAEGVGAGGRWGEGFALDALLMKSALALQILYYL